MHDESRWDEHASFRPHGQIVAIPMMELEPSREGDIRHDSGCHKAQDALTLTFARRVQRASRRFPEGKQAFAPAMPLGKVKKYG